MHASNLLKTVLKPQALSGSGEKSSTVASYAAVPSTKISTKKAAKKKGIMPAPVKMTCLCAPTKHAGSFRCRLHRSQTQVAGANRMPQPLSPAHPQTKEHVETSVVSTVAAAESRMIMCSMPEMVLKPVVSLPAPPPKFSLPRSPPRGASRLNRMIVASHCDDDEIEVFQSPIINEEQLKPEQLKPVKMPATGASSRGWILYHCGRWLPWTLKWVLHGDQSQKCSMELSFISVKGAMHD